MPVPNSFDGAQRRQRCDICLAKAFVRNSGAPVTILSTQWSKLQLPTARVFSLVLVVRHKKKQQLEECLE
jgi:hypothetical protein